MENEYIIRTKNDVSFQAVYDYMYEIAPTILTTMFILIILLILGVFLAYRLGIRTSNSVWKNNIEYHMDKVYKDELIERNIKIEEQQKIILALENDNREKSAAVERMKNITKGL